MLAIAATWPAVATAQSQRPSVVMILMDTTRADRFGSWGSRVDTTPNLDRLASQGVQFLNHFANSHATRPSLPQIVSGRYFYPSILRPFEPDSHPRDYLFLPPDPDARLLTDLVRGAGFHLIGASAHPWVVPESIMGRAFEELDYVAAPPKRGHAEAGAVVDRAIALWDARPGDRPTFLYVHLLDVHTPRHPSGGHLVFLPPGRRGSSRTANRASARSGATGSSRMPVISANATGWCTEHSMTPAYTRPTPRSAA